MTYPTQNGDCPLPCGCKTPYGKCGVTACVNWNVCSSGEVGEISSLFQKIYQGHELNESDLRKEIGDVAWMLAELCTAYGWDMEQVYIENIEKLRARYPKGFSKERSLHREE